VRIVDGGAVGAKHGQAFRRRICFSFFFLSFFFFLNLSVLSFAFPKCRPSPLTFRLRSVSSKAIGSRLRCVTPSRPPPSLLLPLLRRATTSTRFCNSRDARRGESTSTLSGFFVVFRNFVQIIDFECVVVRVLSNAKGDRVEIVRFSLPVTNFSQFSVNVNARCR
jgi:hypothetical protein